MNKDNAFNYYGAYEKQARYAEEMVLNLASAIEGGELGSRELMKALKVIEGDADAINHSIQAHLLSDFVVPMERGSMSALAHALDDVCDGIEQIAIDAYTRKFELEAEGIPRDIAGLIGYLEKGVMSLCVAVSLLKSFDRKSGEIKKRCVEAQSCESNADELYIESVRKLYECDSSNDRFCRVYHEMLDTMEDAMDSVENAAEKLESIVAENV